MVLKQQQQQKKQKTKIYISAWEIFKVVFPFTAYHFPG